MGCVVQAGEASGTIRLEPGADRVRIAVEAPGKLRHASALGMEENGVTACSALRPGAASLLSLGLSMRGEESTDHGGSSQETTMHEEMLPEEK